MKKSATKYRPWTERMPTPVFCPWPGTKVLWRWPVQSIGCCCCHAHGRTLFLYGPTSKAPTSKPVCNLRCLLTWMMGARATRPQ